jgi:hypothetical protein
MIAMALIKANIVFFDLNLTVFLAKPKVQKVREKF